MNKTTAQKIIKEKFGELTSGDPELHNSAKEWFLIGQQPTFWQKCLQRGETFINCCRWLGLDWEVVQLSLFPVCLIQEIKQMTERKKPGLYLVH